nr:hypothetical protein B0A51_15816 [Rachicladosporium sp. CCFEE 5018]
MKIEALLTYPIKGLRAHSLDSAELTKHGFAYDRRFMLLEVKKGEDGSPTLRNMAIAHDPRGSRFFPKIQQPSDYNAKDGKITVVFKPPPGEGEEKTLEIPLELSTEGLEVTEVTMHKSPTKAYQMPEEYCKWFTDCFGYEVILVYLGEHLRPVLMSSTHADATTQQPASGGSTGWLSSITSTATSILSSVTNNAEESKVTFADCAPYLVVSSASMPDLHRRFPEPMKADIMKFRPNIIVSDAEKPWEEDYWGEIAIGGAEGAKIECIHNCGRCKSVNIDYETGKPATDESGKLLAKMQSDRRVDKGVKYSPIFGRYSFLEAGSEGKTVKVGDEVMVTKRNEEHTRFDWKGLATT